MTALDVFNRKLWCPRMSGSSAIPFSGSGDPRRSSRLQVKLDLDTGSELLLPEAQAEEVEVSQKNIIHLLIQEDGSVRIRRGESTAEQVVSASEIEGIMRQEISQNPEIIAAVKTAPDAPYKHMVNVLDELQLAAAQRISLQLWER